MDELMNLDNTFNEHNFLSKVNNIYVMLCTSMMTNNLERVRHYLSNELYEIKKNELEELNNQNVIKMYDELNVNSNIIDVQITDDKFIIKVNMRTKFLDYIINKDTKEFISGNKNYRIEVNKTLVFTKIRNFKELGIVRKCPYCGASMDLNNNGQCRFCKKTFDMKDYDWILEEIR